MTRRRTVLTTASLVAILAAGSTAATVSTSAYADANCEEDLAVVAYLGGGGYAPEQTAAAFTKATAQRPQQISLDVRLTSDGVPVLVSDNNLLRVTNVADVFPDRKNDPINTFTLKELRSLDAGTWFDERFAGERILTLHEVLGYTYPNSIGVSINPRDLTTTSGLATAIIEEFKSDARWQDMMSTGLVEFSSGSIDNLEVMAKLAPDAATMWSPARLPDAASLKKYSKWLDVVGQEYRGFAPSDAVEIHQAGMKAELYDVDSPEAVTKAIGAGADKIVTDYPDVLKAICANRNPLTDANGILISDVRAAADGSDVQAGTKGEYVALTNTSDEIIDVSGYYIRNSAGKRLAVKDGYEIIPGGELRIYTGAGIDTEDKYYNSQTVNVLDNVGDTLAVYTSDHSCVAMYSY